METINIYGNREYHQGHGCDSRKYNKKNLSKYFGLIKRAKKKIFICTT